MDAQATSAALWAPALVARLVSVAVRSAGRTISRVPPAASEARRECCVTDAADQVSLRGLPQSPELFARRAPASGDL
jgi:hypothetical protein